MGGGEGGGEEREGGAGTQGDVTSQRVKEAQGSGGRARKGQGRRGLGVTVGGISEAGGTHVRLC